MENQLESLAPVFSSKPQMSSRKVPRSTKRHQKKSNRVVPVFIRRQQKESTSSMAPSLTSASNGEVQKQTIVPQRHREILIHNCGYWFDKTCPVCLEKAYPLDNYLELPEVDSPSPLGVLEVKLPRELIDMILYRCDIVSLTSLRSVNRRGRQLVSEHPQYMVIVQYVPRLIRFLLDRSLGSASACENVTLGELYSLVTDKHCYQCLSFSIYIDLEKRQRICAECFEDDQRCCGPIDYRSNVSTWKEVTINDLMLHYGILERHEAEQPKRRIIMDSIMLNHYMEKFGRGIPDIPFDVQDHRKIVCLIGARHPEVLAFMPEEHPQYVREQFTKLSQNHCSPWDRVFDAYGRYLAHVLPRLADAQKQRGDRHLSYAQQRFSNSQSQLDRERKLEELVVRAPWLDPKTYKIYWE